MCLKKYNILREEWCRDIPTKVQWVKGHADREGRDLTRYERLNILPDVLAATTRPTHGDHMERGLTAHTGQWKKQQF
jgi:hypothetical protein